MWRRSSRTGVNVDSVGREASPTRVFFDLLSEAERQSLLDSGRSRRWSSGEVMFHRAEGSDSAMVLLDGHVKVHTVVSTGVDVVLGLLGPGEFLGETAAVAGIRSAAVTAIGDVEALVIPAAALRSFLAGNPHVALVLLEVLLARLVIADMRRIEFVNSGSLGRVSARVLELAQRFGSPRDDGGADVMVPIAQEDLASWSASSVESTSRALRTLRQLGVIETGRRRITVLDLERLREHAARL
jgi:CRP/FNR family cyclic AMP-dependent transcriptional regulator